MKSGLKSGILFLSLMAEFFACEAGRPEIIIRLTPNTANLYVTQSLQFTATVNNSTNKAVSWSLSGAGCSGITCGTISSTGLYTTPASVPSPAIVEVKATSMADTSKSAIATITILAAVDIWTWISGSNEAYQAGVYGTKGIADPANVPGARYAAISWVDSSGKFWLFGGDGYGSAGNSGFLNDLWKYDPASNEWTWVSGSDLGYQPGAYGIKGISDPSNVPGARYAAISWVDSSGKFWLYGGFGFYSAGNYGYLNDLWKYDPASNEWTWVSGSNEGDQVGIYGIKGIADPANVPGGKWGAISWIDSSSKLWLFGGDGVYMPGNAGLINDLWNYDPTSNEWTWISGSNDAYQAGTYGTKGIAAPSNVPGARCQPLSWLDSSGNLWLFGGEGNDSASPYQGPLNDLWKYDPSVQEWTWISGSDIREQPGIYGTRGVSDPSNVPGARSAALSWLDSSGNLWLFGGSGVNYSNLSDLWRYNR